MEAQAGGLRLSQAPGDLLNDRAEYVLVRALDDGRIDYRLGDTKIRNPDLILPSDSGDLGIEVTSVTPAGVIDLCEQIERDVLVAHEEFGVSLVFSGYPSRVPAGAATAVCDDLSVLAAAGDTTTGASVPLGDAVKNQGALSATACLTTGSGIRWETAGGDLKGPLASAEYAVLQAGLDGRSSHRPERSGPISRERVTLPAAPVTTLAGLAPRTLGRTQHPRTARRAHREPASPTDTAPSPPRPALPARSLLAPAATAAPALTPHTPPRGRRRKSTTATRPTSITTDPQRN